MTHAKIATKISRSARWALLESLLSAGASMLTVVALARFLAPGEFGQAGLAIAVSAIIQATLLGGMPDALVRSPSTHSRLVDAAFWAMAGLGIAATALATLAAVLVAYGLGQHELGALIAGQGLSGVALGAAAAPTGLLLRKMRTRALVNRTLVSKLVGLVVAVALAWQGAGAWAIVGGNVVAQTAGTLQLIATMRRPRLRFWDPGLPATLRIGALSGTQQTLGTLTTRGFILGFGAVYGVHAVGLFNFALRLVEESGGVVITTLRRVTVTSFAQARRRGLDLHAMFRRGTSMIAHVAAPLFLGIAAVAPDAVPLFFGRQWIDAVPALQLMLAMWVLRSTRMLVNAINLVDGRQRAMLVFAVAGVAATAAAFVASLPFGVEATTFAYAATLVGVVFGGRYFARATGIGGGEQLAAGARPVLCALIMAAGVSLLRLGPLRDLPEAARLAIEIGAGGVLYAVLIAAVDRDGVRDVVRMIRR